MFKNVGSILKNFSHYHYVRRYFNVNTFNYVISLRNIFKTNEKKIQENLKLDCVKFVSLLMEKVCVHIKKKMFSTQMR